jgi:hypothetical protein
MLLLHSEWQKTQTGLVEKRLLRVPLILRMGCSRETPRFRNCSCLFRFYGRFYLFNAVVYPDRGTHCVWR